MITPRYLIPGDTVGIIAPARKVNPGDIGSFVKLLESWGLSCKMGRHLFEEENQYSGSDEIRAEDITGMINDPEVRAIFAARGGYGSLRALRKVDFGNFEKDPKWFAGFSDITVIHSYINKYLNTESLHCMMPFSFVPGSAESEGSAESIRKALFGEKLNYTFPGSHANRPGSVKAELTGGNLSVLYSLNGTGFFPDMKTKILFIEDVDEYLYHIDRMLVNFFLSGVLRDIRGLIIGGFTGLKDNEVKFGKDYDEIITEITGRYDYPVAFSFPAGHQVENKTLILGREIQLRVNESESILEFAEK
jgi:muramoyltetrapeptide carboxypeptidase